MKYVVTDEDVDVVRKEWERWAHSGWTLNRAWKEALESFAKTLGEPVAVPDGCRHVAEIADINGEALCAVVDINTPNVLVVGDKLYLHPAAAPHHPATEKGCE